MTSPDEAFREWVRKKAAERALENERAISYRERAVPLATPCVSVIKPSGLARVLALMTRIVNFLRSQFRPR